MSSILLLLAAFLHGSLYIIENHFVVFLDLAVEVDVGSSSPPSATQVMSSWPRDDPFSDKVVGLLANLQVELVPQLENVAPSSSRQQPPKNSLAATVVESTTKQSLALVPKDVSKLAQRFFHLFNPALFPYRPPTGPVANQILFTDAEDELLASEMMEYNTDSKAIQQRFLPCKTKHQDCQAEKSGREKSAGGLTDNNAGGTYVHEAWPF
ncbi:hypothetical protein ACFX2I_036918 [Malus domestica]